MNNFFCRVLCLGGGEWDFGWKWFANGDDDDLGEADGEVRRRGEKEGEGEGGRGRGDETKKIGEGGTMELEK